MSRLDSVSLMIRADSTNASLFYQRAGLLLDEGNVNDALADMNRAIQLDQDESEYFVTLSDIYLAMNKITSSLEALQKAEELDPSNNQALLKQAELYLILQDYQNVFTYTKKAIDLDRNNPVAFFIRGYALMERGDTAEAVRNYQKAAELDQSYYEALVQLGLVYIGKNASLAASYFKRATEVNPNRTEGFYLLGLACQEEEDIPEAIEAYENLVTIDPGYKEGFYNLGYIHLVYLNEFGAAARFFTQAIDLDKSYVDAYFNRGYCYELLGDLDKAREDYNTALRISPNYDRAINGLNRLDSLMTAN